MRSTRTLGVSFCQGRIQLAEVEQGKAPNLLALAEAETSLDLAQAGIHLSAEHPQVATLVGELGDLIKRNKAGAKVVSFAIPPDPIFISIIPLSITLQGQALTQYLQWELSQYFPETPPKDFVIDAQPLPSTDNTVNPTFVVGVRRRMIGFLQKVASELRLQLSIVNIDHFCIEKTLQFNYPEISGYNIALFGLRFGGIDASLLKDNVTIDYRAFALQQPPDVGKTVAAYLKHLKQRDGVTPPEAILFHGQEVPVETIKQLRTDTKKQVLMVNAVRKLTVSGKIYQPFLKESYRFAAAIGVGLRSPS